MTQLVSPPPHPHPGQILAGYAADPPGFEFYHQKLDAHGRPMVDEHGDPLLDCSRGTNDVECVHKQLTTTFGSWCVGIKLSDYLLAEFRHRYTHRCSERRRIGFPKVGGGRRHGVQLPQSSSNGARRATRRLLHPPLPPSLAPSLPPSLAWSLRHSSC